MTSHVLTAGEASPLAQALNGALKGLNPARWWRSPVMLVVWVGAALTTADAVVEPSAFAWWIAAWLWATVVFAAAAESVAEGKGKARAASLRKNRADLTARLVTGRDERIVPASELTVGALVRVSAGETVPADGEIVAGAATIDESAMTGESAPVVREAGGDRSSCTGGTRVLSDEFEMRVTARPG